MLEPTYLVPRLLLGALVLPTLGAILARLVGRWSRSALGVVAVIGAIGAVACVVALQWLPAGQVSFGRYAIFVPARVPLIDEQTFALVRSTSAPAVAVPPAVTIVAVAPSASPSATVAATSSPTASAVATPTLAPTVTPTIATPTTATPSDTPVPTPTRKPTAQPTATVGRRIYVVQKGDSLRSIAADFDISVQALLDANDLTAKEGDNLQIDQKLVIPSRRK